MSFVPIDPVDHTDTFSITTWNNIKAGVDAIFLVLGTAGINNPALGNFEYGHLAPDNDFSMMAFIHKNRFLIYEGDGRIIDPSGVGDTITLSDPENVNEVGEYDLDSIDWLTYGMQYRVDGVEWCAEYEKGGYII